MSLNMFSFLSIPTNVAFPLPGIPRLLVAFCEWLATATVIIATGRSDFDQHGDSSLRFPNRRITLALLAALPVQCFLRCVFPPDVHLHKDLFALSMVVNLAFMLLCIRFLQRYSWRESLFLWTFAFLDAEFTASFAWQMCAVLIPQADLRKPVVLFFLAVLIIITRIIVYSFGESSYVSDPHRDLRQIAQALAVAAISFIAGNFNVFRTTNLQPQMSADSLQSIGWIRTLVDACGLVILFLLLSLDKERRAYEEMSIIHSVMREQYKQYLNYRENSDYIARQCHDLKYQIAALRTSVSEEEREAYLTELEEIVAEYSLHSNTGNPALDTLITQKHIYCRQHNIQFSYHVEGSSLAALPIREICILFGNLLDNAVESALTIEDPSRRQILLDVTKRGGLLSIRMENCCDPQLTLSPADSAFPETTKVDRRSHGYGLRSIRYITEKYGGSFECSAADGWFTATVLLPLP